MSGVFFSFPRIKSTQQPLYNFPFDVFSLIKVSFLSLFSPGEEGERTQKFTSAAGSAAAGAAAVAAGQAEPPPALPKPLGKALPRGQLQHHDAVSGVSARCAPRVTHHGGNRGAAKLLRALRAVESDPARFRV